MNCPERNKIKCDMSGFVSRGVKSCMIDSNNHLIMLMTDGARLDLGKCSMDHDAVFLAENSVQGNYREPLNAGTLADLAGCIVTCLEDTEHYPGDHMTMFTEINITRRLQSNRINLYAGTHYLLICGQRDDPDIFIFDTTSGNQSFITVALNNEMSIASFSESFRKSEIMQLIGPEYSSSMTYAAKRFILHDGQLYRNLVAITTPEEWNPAHWMLVNVATGMDVLSQETSAVQTFAQNLIKVGVGTFTHSSAVESSVVTVRSRGNVIVFSGVIVLFNAVQPGTLLGQIEEANFRPAQTVWATSIASSGVPGCLELGPDGKLYSSTALPIERHYFTLTYTL